MGNRCLECCKGVRASTCAKHLRTGGVARFSTGPQAHLRPHAFPTSPPPACDPPPNPQVQKSAQHYTEAARDEVTLLDQLRDGDPESRSHCVRLLDHFEHMGPHGLHVCLVFEVLGDNLLALIKAYDYRGLPLPVVKNLARQMLVALDYMHSRCSILHTDLKPENVMLVDTLAPRRWELELPPAPAPVGGVHRQAGAGGGQQTGATAAGGGSSGGALSKSQKKKAKRKAKVAAAGGAAGGDDSQHGSQLTGEASSMGASVQEEGEEVAGPSSGGASAAADGAQHVNGSGAAAAGEQQQEGQQQEDQQQQQARRRLVYESRVLHSAKDLATAQAKVVDFGNACWTYKRFTDDVQTRQYRCPEVILGAK